MPENEDRPFRCRARTWREGEVAPRLCEIRLTINLALIEGQEEPENASDIEDDDELVVDVLVRECGNCRFRLEEPVSLLMCPILNLGDVIQTAQERDGGFRLVSFVERAAVWGCTIGKVPPDAVRDERCAGILDDIRGIGGGWESTVGNLVIQEPSTQEGPSPRLKCLLERLVERLEVLRGNSDSPRDC